MKSLVEQYTLEYVEQKGFVTCEFTCSPNEVENVFRDIYKYDHLLKPLNAHWIVRFCSTCQEHQKGENYLHVEIVKDNPSPAIVVRNLLCAIAERFDKSINSIKIDIADDVGLIFSISVECLILAENKFSDADFRLFCKKHKLNGSILFEKHNSITFMMSPYPSCISY